MHVQKSVGSLGSPIGKPQQPQRLDQLFSRIFSFLDGDYKVKYRPVSLLTSQQGEIRKNDNKFAHRSTNSRFPEWLKETQHLRNQMLIELKYSPRVNIIEKSSLKHRSYQDLTSPQPQAIKGSSSTRELLSFKEIDPARKSQASNKSYKSNSVLPPLTLNEKVDSSIFEVGVT